MTVGVSVMLGVSESVGVAVLAAVAVFAVSYTHLTLPTSDLV